MDRSLVRLFLLVAIAGIHCHILDHEDAGMMLNIEIVPDASQPNGGLGMPGMKHMH